jgi:hypothetical protein
LARIRRFLHHISACFFRETGLFAFTGKTALVSGRFIVFFVQTVRQQEAKADMAPVKLTDLLYCPRSLREELPDLASFRNVLIEAPAGFGKSTTLRHFIQPSLTDGGSRQWVHHVCAKESSPAT